MGKPQGSWLHGQGQASTSGQRGQASTSRQHGQVDTSRLTNLMERIDSGQPYGDLGDIDMLLEEVVKRLEGRMVAKIDQILDRVTQPNECTGTPSPRPSPIARGFESSWESSPPSSPQRIRKISSKSKAMLEPNMDLLVHEAQDIVQDVIMNSMESLMALSAAEGAQREASSFRPSRVGGPYKNRNMTTGRNNRDDFKMATTSYPERHYDSRPSGGMRQQTQGRDDRDRLSGGMRQQTQDRDARDDFEITTSSYSERRYDSRPSGGRRQQTQGKVSSSSTKPRPSSSPQQGALFTDDGSLNPTYTYILRNSVQRSLPKYLSQDGGQSRDAMMHIFNDIRSAMADDSIEGIITDVLEKAFFEEGEQPSSSGVEDIHDQMLQNEVDDEVTDEPQQTRPAAKHRERTASSANEEKTPKPAKQWKETTEEVTGDDASIRYDSNLNYLVRRALSRAVPKYTCNKLVSGALLRLSDKLMEEVPLQVGSLSLNHNDIEFNSSDKEEVKEVPKSSKNVSKTSPKEDMPWVTKGKTEDTPSPKKLPCKDTNTGGDLPWVSSGQDAQYTIYDLYTEDLPWVKHNENTTTAKELPKPSRPVSQKSPKAEITKGTNEDLQWVTKGTPTPKSRKEDLPWVTKGETERVPSPKKLPCKDTAKDSPWVSRGQDAKYTMYDIYTDDIPWVTQAETDMCSKATHDSSTDMPWVRKGIAVTDTARNACPRPYKKRTEIPAHELPSRMAVSTQTSLRALCDDCEIYPQTPRVTAGRYWNTNQNQSGDSIIPSSEDGIKDEIFYDALCSLSDLQNTLDHQDDNMSFLKRFRFNLLFRKKKVTEKKFVHAVHKVIEARRSGCIDDDGNFVQSIPPPSPKNDGNKSPPPTVKPKPNKALDKNGNKRESKKRGSSKRRHNPDRESYPLPEEDDGSEGYASASEMDNFDFNPTAFLERNRRSAENSRFYKDDGAEADVESDSDGANSSNRRVRFSDDVQHFGDILAEIESSDNLDAEDDEPDKSQLSLKSKIELFEKVGSNEFLDERSNQGSPPPDIPEKASLPTKDRVKLFEDIHSGKKPTTCAATHKIPRRAVDSCQFTYTQSKISFFEQLNDH